MQLSTDLVATIDSTRHGSRSANESMGDQSQEDGVNGKREMRRQLVGQNLDGLRSFQINGVKENEEDLGVTSICENNKL